MFGFLHSQFKIYIKIDETLKINVELFGSPILSATKIVAGGTKACCLGAGLAYLLRVSLHSTI